jgi:hypothetical protein
MRADQKRNVVQTRDLDFRPRPIRDIALADFEWVAQPLFANRILVSSPSAVPPTISMSPGDDSSACIPPRNGVTSTISTFTATPSGAMTRTRRCHST